MARPLVTTVLSKGISVSPRRFLRCWRARQKAPSGGHCRVRLGRTRPPKLFRAHFERHPSVSPLVAAEVPRSAWRRKMPIPPTCQPLADALETIGAEIADLQERLE